MSNAPTTFSVRKLENSIKKYLIHVGHPCILGCSHLAVDLIGIVAWEQKEAKNDGQKPSETCRLQEDQSKSLEKQK